MIDVVGGVVGGDLVEDFLRLRFRLVGLAAVDQRVPAVQVGFGVGEGVVARGEAGPVEAADVGGLLDPDAGAAVGAFVGGVGGEVEGAAVRHQRVGEVAPGP